MLKPVASLLLFVAFVFAPPTAAGLKYTVHLEVRQAAGGSQDQLSMLMANVMSNLIPPGGVDQAVSVSDKGTRAEQKQAFSGLPAGAVLLTRPDGSGVGMDPAAKTFWKQPTGTDVAANALAQMGGAKPDVKVKKTGEFETIDGMKAERVNVTLGLPLPMDPAQLPPGFPTQLTITMDVWVTDAIKSPVTGSAASNELLAKFLPDPTALKDLNDGRFMLRQVMSMFGLEIVTTVKDVVKGDVADTLFDVPKDYKEVPPPGGGGLTGGRH
jgi:hypothetical protein